MGPAFDWEYLVGYACSLKASGSYPLWKGICCVTTPSHGPCKGERGVCCGSLTAHALGKRCLLCSPGFSLGNVLDASCASLAVSLYTHMYGRSLLVLMVLALRNGAPWWLSSIHYESHSVSAGKLWRDISWLAWDKLYYWASYVVLFFFQFLGIAPCVCLVILGL